MAPSTHKSWDGYVDNEGRIVLPARLRKKLGLKPGDMLLVQGDKKGFHATKTGNLWVELEKVAEEALERGLTIPLEQYAKEHGIDLDALPDEDTE